MLTDHEWKSRVEFIHEAVSVLESLRDSKGVGDGDRFVAALCRSDDISSKTDSWVQKPVVDVFLRGVRALKNYRDTVHVYRNASAEERQEDGIAGLLAPQMKAFENVFDSLEWERKRCVVLRTIFLFLRRFTK